MSTIAIVYSILTTLASLAWDYMRRKQIRNLRNGQEQWRAAAIAAGNQVESWQVATLRANDKSRQLREVIAHIWGSPPLNRNAADVIGYIKELQRITVRQQVDKSKLAEAYQNLSGQMIALEATLAARTQDLTLVESALRELQQEYLKLQRSSDQAENFEATRAEKGLTS